MLKNLKLDKKLLFIVQYFNANLYLQFLSPRFYLFFLTSWFVIV